MLLLPEHRKRPRGLADLLPWAALVAPGVVLNKDGSLLTAWAYRGPDVDSATPEELAILARHLNQALLSLGGDWMLHVDALRAPAPGYPPRGAFPDPVTALIDEERRQQYAGNGAAGEGRSHHFETRYILTLTHMPHTESASRALSWLIEGETGPAVGAHGHLRLFHHRAQDLEDLLSSRLEIHRLSSEDLLAHLHTCVTGLDHPIALPDPPCYLDVLLASQDLRGGFAPKIGRHHLAPVAITGFPAASLPGILDPLSRLALPYRFSSRWLPLEPEAAQRHLQRLRRNWWQKRKGMAALLTDLFHSPGQSNHPFPNQDAVKMAEDADRAIAESASGQVRFGYLTPAILLMSEHRSELEDATRTLLKTLRNHGFAARLEEVNALEAYLGSLPGQGTANVRRPLISTRNLAHLLPMTSVWAGERENPCPYFPKGSPALLWAATSGATPFRWNLHVSDVGHTLIVGPTGAGKSTLLGLLQAQWFRYPGAQVFCFDKGYSAMPLVLAAGGNHYPLAGNTPESLAFTPLADIDQPHERAWAAEWLETLFDLLRLALTPTQRRALHQALDLLATAPSRTLTDLVVRLQDETLREALRPYTLEGPLGTLLDAQTDGLGEGRFQVFETSHLMELREKVVVPVLLTLFHRIEARLDGRPTLLVLDEAWTFLLHGLFAERIRSWLKELRKKNAAVLFATQSLADLERSEHRFLLYESCPTKVFLPNPEAATDTLRPLYRDLGLNPREIETLASATPKRDYYITGPRGRRLVDLTLGPAALAFVGASDKESLRRIQHLHAQHGPAWPRLWLRERLKDQGS